MRPDIPPEARRHTAPSGKVPLELEVERMMARVRAVLESDGKEISRAEEHLFETTCLQMVQFGPKKWNPIVSAVDHVGNYWRNWLLLILHTGAHRPSKISRLLEALDPAHPISQRMMTLNLRLLERDGLVKRSIICEKLKHVEYSLTPMGDELADLVSGLTDWIGAHAGKIARARTAFDEEHILEWRAR